MEKKNFFFLLSKLMPVRDLSTMNFSLKKKYALNLSLFADHV